MKKELLFFILAILMCSCSNNEENDFYIPEDNEEVLGGGIIQFMDRLEATLPLEGGSVEFKANKTPVYIHHISVISENDTINEAFDWTDWGENESIIRDCYKIEFKTNPHWGISKDEPLNLKLESLPNGINNRKLIIVMTWANLRNSIIVNQE